MIWPYQTQCLEKKLHQYTLWLWCGYLLQWNCCKNTIKHMSSYSMVNYNHFPHSGTVTKMEYRSGIGGNKAILSVPLFPISSELSNHCLPAKSHFHIRQVSQLLPRHLATIKLILKFLTSILLLNQNFPIIDKLTNGYLTTPTPGSWANHGMPFMSILENICHVQECT